jgi:hypothetical protein
VRPLLLLSLLPACAPSSACPNVPTWLNRLFNEMPLPLALGVLVPLLLTVPAAGRGSAAAECMARRLASTSRYARSALPLPKVMHQLTSM